MARRVARNTAQLGMQLDSELLAAVRSFSASRSETIREVIEMALRRHLANPPAKVEPPPIPPLPPFPPPAVAAKKVDKKK